MKTSFFSEPEIQESAKMTNIELLDFAVVEICNKINAYFAIKGGYALSKILKEPRLTKDVDLSIATKESYDEFKIVLADIGNKLIDMNIIDEFTVKDGISETMSGGAIYKLNNIQVFGIDVGLHQLALGVKKVSLNIGDINMFSTERMLADKITAILSRQRFRRTKDIYDLYCLVTNFTIDYLKLKELLDLRLAGREELWDNIPFNEKVLIEYEKAYEKLQVKSIFTEDTISKPEFAVVHNVFEKFVKPYKYGYVKTKWDPKNEVWLNDSL